MSKNYTNTNEKLDIYPLTIVTMRYGGKIVVLNCEADSGFVSDIEGNENIFTRIEEWMEENVDPCNYGIGDTISEALDDYEKRLKAKKLKIWL